MQKVSISYRKRLSCIQVSICQASEQPKFCFLFKFKFNNFCLIILFLLLINYWPLQAREKCLLVIENSYLAFLFTWLSFLFKSISYKNKELNLQ